MLLIYFVGEKGSLPFTGQCLLFGDCGNRQTGVVFLRNAVSYTSALVLVAIYSEFCFIGMEEF